MNANRQAALPASARFSAWQLIRKTYAADLTRSRTIISILIGAAAWEFGARYLFDNPLILVPLTAVFQSFLKLISTGELQKHIYVSMVEFSLGFVLAVVVGITLGMITATSRTARDYVDPWISALYTTPSVALAPLFIIWFGIDIGSKIAVIFLVSVFPIIINTATGIRSTDNNLIEAARSFGANQTQIFTNVLLPSATPFIVAGLRLGIGRGLVGIVVGEMFGSRAGLGFLIVAAGQTFDTAGLFVGVLTLAIAGIIAVELCKWVEKRLAPWREFKYD